MTVLSVAYPLFPVGPGAAGGSEQILFLLERELVRNGIRSIVVAAKGSEVRGELAQSPATDQELTDSMRAEAQRTHLRIIERVLREEAIDLIHFHGLDFASYVPQTKTAKLATLHLPPDWYPREIFDCPELELNCVSEKQAAAVPGAKRPHVVPNGIDLTQYPESWVKRDGLLWLGRICPEKGVHIALRVAHRLGKAIKIAGPVHAFHDHQRYFEEEVKPLLDEERRFIGPVSGSEKIQLLAHAECLLIPSLVAETSSLVAMEAAAAGTPAIAFRSGALPEVIEHGCTGFIVDSEEEMVAALELVHQITANDCRRAARARFDGMCMAEKYRRLYERITDGRSSLLAF